MKSFLILSIAASALAFPTIVSRTSQPFIGKGWIHVVDGQNKQLGCLTKTMAFTTDTSTACNIFTITQKNDTSLPVHITVPAYTILSSAGPCGQPLEQKSVPGQGKRHILLCGAHSDSAHASWSVTAGSDGLLGQSLLTAADHASSFTTVEGCPPNGTEAKALEPVVAGTTPQGEQYSLTWYADS